MNMAAASGHLMKFNMNNPPEVMTIRAVRLTARAGDFASERLLQMRDGRMNPGKAATGFFCIAWE